MVWYSIVWLLVYLYCYFLQELEENLRDAQSTAQRMETQLVQKERLYEDKIKVRHFFQKLCIYGNAHKLFHPPSVLSLELVLFCHMSQSCHMSYSDDFTPH